jgi:hypothetical protein
MNKIDQILDSLYDRVIEPCEAKEQLNAIIHRCSSCKNWTRYSIYNWPDQDKQSKLGSCSVLENDVRYFDTIDELTEKVKDGCIGGENLCTHENFGCIHYKNIKE